MEKYFELNGSDTPEYLAKVFSSHLTSYRANKNLTTVGRITSYPPDAEKGWLRIPHLVTTVKADEMSEVVIWEKLSEQDARQWLGTEVPDQDLVEEHLYELLELKKRFRENTLDPILHKEIKNKLFGRYFSILFVYQNFQLFSDLWNEGINSDRN